MVDQPHECQHSHADARQLAIRTLTTKLDRRVIVKAGLAMGAMAAAGGLSIGNCSRGARAQEAGETIAETWTEAGSGGEGVAAQAWQPGPVTVQANFPFTAVGAHWSGSVTFPVQVRISLSSDGATFTEPVVVAAATVDAGRPDRDGRIFADLVFADYAQWVQYETLDGDGLPAQVEGFSLTFIDASAGPSSYDTGVGATALEAQFAQPPIISRQAWGANESYRYENGQEVWPPEYQTVEHVIIHHTETPNFQDPFVAIRSIYYYHAVTRGWGDIGYNYLVDYRGNIYEGRYGGENVIGGHAFQYAEGSAGIAAIGSFNFQDTTLETQAGLVAITAWAARNLDPYDSKQFHQVPNLPTIAGHRDVVQSACPGDQLYADLPVIRDYVAQVLSGGAGPDGDQGFAVGQQVRTSVSDGNLRSYGSLSAPVVATMPYGTVLTITGTQIRADDLAWYPVSGSYGAGWAAAIILEPLDGSNPNPGTGGLQVGDTAVVNTDALNLRQTASLAGAVMTVLLNGSEGTVLDGPVSADGYQWYQLQTSQGTGWAAGQFLAKKSAGGTDPDPGGDEWTAGTAVTVNTDFLNMRQQPSLSGSVVAVLPYGTPLTITGGPQQADGYTWYSVQTAQGGTGWCVSVYLAAGGPGADPGTPNDPNVIEVGDTVVAVNTIQMRSGPSLSRSVTATVPSGTQLEVTDPATESEGAVWYGVYAPGYGGGWVRSTDIAEPGSSNPTPAPTPPPSSGTFPVGTTVRVVDGSLNFRTGPGTSSRVANVVPEGTQFTVTGSPVVADGYTWYPVTNSGYGDGWCAGEYLRAV